MASSRPTFDHLRPLHECSRTLTQNNLERLKFLPVFPGKLSIRHYQPLFSSMPANTMTPAGRAQRRDGAFTPEALALLSRYEHQGAYSISLEDCQALADRLRVGMSIITFNATLLREICYYFVALHERFRKDTPYISKTSTDEPCLSSSSMAVALEFFLQFDVDDFFMKTSCFRDAEPRSATEGLFCGDQPPSQRYEMSQCYEQSCQCCNPSNIERRAYHWPVVDFEHSPKHRFCKDYISYLNAPATCTTTNIIYVMRCPCEEYEYIGSTDQTLADAILYHRRRVNEVIHYYLTGSPLGVDNDGDIQLTEETERLKAMRLYRHSARCREALLTFLSANPKYWCFIPQRYNESMMANSDCMGEPRNRDSEVDRLVETGVIEEPLVAEYLHRVPLPPTRYAFSYQQRQQQRIFFRNLVSGAYAPLPYFLMDLHKYNIIAVLPDNTSRLLRYIVETLFIVHAETELNMICPVGGDVEHRYGQGYMPEWCRHVDPSELPTGTRSTTSLPNMMNTL